MATIEFKFYKEDKGVEKIVKEKKIERMTDEKLTEEIANVISSKSEYKQIVAWWNPVPIVSSGKSSEWDCTLRTQIIPLSQTCDYKAIKHPETPLCLSFEYRDKEYWVMRVEKAINEGWRKRIEVIRIMIRGVLEAKEKQEPGFFSVGK